MAESLIMDIGGWKTPAVFKRYAISDRRSKAAACVSTTLPTGARPGSGREWAYWAENTPRQETQ